ncbi:MAG: NAD(P)/FAD-dependent oxidoreductase [Thermodesulfobacteriota bacterium]|nr:NAD(P)/FAD-dependent oxidoreductase [Thermodesulfobacteriota bacterium]
MAEKYDFIIVGGGHNGLTCGAYLARAGQKVIVMERRDLWGGGVMTEKFKLPGFVYNPHSAGHEWIFMGPVYNDLELKKHGSHYKFRPLSAVFEDDRSVIQYRDVDKTCKTIEQFSRKDAVAYKEMVNMYMDAVELIVTGYMFNSPMPPSKWMAQFEGTYGGREFIRMMQTSPYYLCEQLFESDQVKTFILFHVTQSGIPLDSFGSGLFFPMMFPAMHKSGMGTSVGGSKSLSDGMVRAMEAYGGVIRINSEVKEIMVKDGIAMGVKLADGVEYLANKAVICNVGPTLIFGNGKMVGEEHLDKAFINQIRNWRPGEMALYGLHLALDEQIDYKAARIEPDINKCYAVYMCENTEILQKQFSSIRIGEFPQGENLGMLGMMPTVVDSTQAPPGKHTAFIWQYATNTYYQKGGQERWDEVRDEYAEECLNFWSKYTNNLSKPDIILEKHIETPSDIVRRNPSMIGGDFSGGTMDQDQIGIFRPFHGYPPYRTPIENLYMCGPTTHPGGGCSGACGYNAANVVAEDFKIKKWWPTPSYFGGAPEEELTD